MQILVEGAQDAPKAPLVGGLAGPAVDGQSHGQAVLGVGEAEVRARLENIMSLVPRRQTSGG